MKEECLEIALASFSGGPYGENLASSYGYSDPIGTGLTGWENEACESRVVLRCLSHLKLVLALFSQVRLQQPRLQLGNRSFHPGERSCVNGFCGMMLTCVAPVRWSGSPPLNLVVPLSLALLTPYTKLP